MEISGYLNGILISFYYQAANTKYRQSTYLKRTRSIYFLSFTNNSLNEFFKADNEISIKICKLKAYYNLL